MTVENNYAIAIDTLKDWLKNLVPVFQPLRRKTKTNRNLYFIALFILVVIGRSNNIDTDFSIVI